MPDLDDERQRAALALVGSIADLAQRAQAEPDPERSAHLAAAARDLSEVLTSVRPQGRGRAGARSAVVQSLRQASAARVKAPA